MISSHPFPLFYEDNLFTRNPFSIWSQKVKCAKNSFHLIKMTYYRSMRCSHESLCPAAQFDLRLNMHIAISYNLPSIDWFSVINVQFTAEQFNFVALNQWKYFDKSFISNKNSRSLGYFFREEASCFQLFISLPQDINHMATKEWHWWFAEKGTIKGDSYNKHARDSLASR